MQVLMKLTVCRLINMISIHGKGSSYNKRIHFGQYTQWGEKQQSSPKKKKNTNRFQKPLRHSLHIDYKDAINLRCLQVLLISDVWNPLAAFTFIVLCVPARIHRVLLSCFLYAPLCRGESQWQWISGVGRGPDDAAPWLARHLSRASKWSELLERTPRPTAPGSVPLRAGRDRLPAFDHY